MNIVFFAHPTFLKLRSMDNYADMLIQGMMERGHHIQVWRPGKVLSALPFGKSAKKWLGYLDQYFLFPIGIRIRVHFIKKETIFVFTDQALGPWVPVVKNKPHLIHCHDFLAYRSAKGEFHQNITGWTGRIYQKYIHSGYSSGKNFVSVSKKTNEELRTYLPHNPVLNKTVYNGLNKVFKPLDKFKAREHLIRTTGIELEEGYIVHVGGNQWYKNRTGLIEIYNAWRAISCLTYPLLMIGEDPDETVLKSYQRSMYKNDIYFITGKSDEFIQNAYAGGSVLLFPSVAEGFGWPIAEAMACACLVITTNLEPLTEVGKDAAFYIEQRPNDPKESEVWAKKSATVLENVLKLPEHSYEAAVEKGIENSKRFDVDIALNTIEKIYQSIVNSY